MLRKTRIHLKRNRKVNFLQRKERTKRNHLKNANFTYFIYTHNCMIKRTHTTCYLICFIIEPLQYAICLTDRQMNSTD